MGRAIARPTQAYLVDGIISREGAVADVPEPVCPDVPLWGRGVTRPEVLHGPRISVPRPSRVLGVYPPPFVRLVVPPVGLIGVGAAESDPRGGTNPLEDYLVRLRGRIDDLRSCLRRRCGLPRETAQASGAARWRQGQLRPRDRGRRRPPVLGLAVVGAL